MVRNLKSQLQVSRRPYVSALVLFVVAILFLAPPDTITAETRHVWEKVEISLHSSKAYENPYTDVEVWADLKGPGFNKRCYGFWDGDNTFRVRVLATAPGTWTWSTGSNQDDSGLNGKTGKSVATAWDEARKEENPCRRGMIKASANGHAFEYADGMPFFLLGDTWWATPTFRYRWYDDDKARPLGPTAGFKDYVRFRRKQGFNCIAMIAAFPNWANDGKPRSLKTPDGTVLRSAWQQPGTESAKDMHDEDGNRAFLFPGKVPGFENHFPDLDRINPKYFQNLDKKIDYLNANGFVPFIEVARRDIGQGWKKYCRWPESYSRYVQYIWSRYQANICLFSPIHLDWTGATIPADDWNQAANEVIEKYGAPPFGTLAGTNSNPSTLRNFGHVDKAKWLTFHQIGNRRTHNNYAYLTEIFNTSPAVPGINGEPYYAGMHDAPGGTPTSALYCRSGMYGSVLSGGLGGHIYGAGGWDGALWGGNVEDVAENHIWDALKWPSGDQMRHLAAFVLSEGPRYQELVPSRELVQPNESGDPKGYVGWSYCARTGEKDFFLLYFEKDCPQAALSGALSRGKYKAKWFNTRTGDWIDAAVLAADASGNISLPSFPDNSSISKIDWGLKLTSLRASVAQVRSSADDKRAVYRAIEIFPLVKQHVHGSTIVELPNGDLLAAWFQGSGERWADDVAIMGARLQAGEQKWSKPFVMADVPEFPDINPILFIDPQDRLWLMWYTVIANQWETSLPKYRISENYTTQDGPPEWSWQDVLHVKPGDRAERGIQPGDRFVKSIEKQVKEYAEYVARNTSMSEQVMRGIADRWAEDLLAKAGGKNMMRKGRLYDASGRYTEKQLGYPYFRRVGWQTKNKAVIVDKKRLIVPLYSDGFSFSLMAITDDGGKTWQFSEPLVGAGNIQASIAKKADGTLVAYMRDNGPPPQRLHVSRSKDKGLTWSPVRDSELPNPGSGADVVTMQNGHWALAYNDTQRGRHSLAVSVSTDEGKTWEYTRHLERDMRDRNIATSSAYPSIIQGRDGTLHVVYSYHHHDRKGGPNKTIKYAQFNEAWVRAGKASEQK